MSSFKSIFIFLSFFLIISFLLPSCKAIKSISDSVAGVKGDVDKITADFNKISNALVPIDTLVYDAVSGALDGVTSDESKKKLESLTAELSKNIVKYVNQALDSLDTATPAEKLITGIKDSLFAQSTSDEMTKLLDQVISGAGSNIDNVLKEIIDRVTSADTKKQLKGLGDAVVSGITDSLSYKINQSIIEINFNQLGDSLASILSEKLEDRIVEIVGNASGKASEELTTNAQPTLQFIKDNVVSIITTLGLVLAGLMWLLYRFRSKSKKSDNLKNLIQAMSDDDNIKKLKDQLKEKNLL